MGSLEEFSFPTRLFLKAYAWKKIDPTPWARLEKPVSEAKLALISSAGFILPNQTPFNEFSPGGDVSFREIPNDADLSKLREFHRSESFDHRGIERDPNLAFPLDRLRELEKEKMIGSLNHRHFSFMGSIVAPSRFIQQTIPETAEKLTQDQIDVALLVPV
jgi:D-proline reductase (dithiol) PrdB